MQDQMGYEGSAMVDVAVLPSRVAYLIPEGNPAAAKESVQIATSRWGGLTEPIVEVSNDGTVAEQYGEVVRRSDVVGLVAVDLPEPLATIASTQLSLECVPSERIGTKLARCTVHPQAVAMTGPHNLRIASPESELWEVVATGMVSAGEENPIRMRERCLAFAESHLDVFEAQAKQQIALRRTVAQFEVKDLNYEYGGRGPTVIWVAAADNVQDCLAFWNFRGLRWLSEATHEPVMLVPVDAVRDLPALPRWLEDALRRPAGYTPDVVLQSINAPRSALQAVADRLGLTPTDEPLQQQFDGPILPLRQAPYTYRIDPGVESLAAFGRTYGRSTRTEVHLYGDTIRVRCPSPVDFHQSGGTLLHLSSRLFDGYPRRPVIAELFTKTARWHRDDLELRMQARSNYEFHLQTPSLSLARDELLKSATATAVLSDKGLIGDALQQTLDMTMLREPGVFDLLVELMTPRSKTLTKQLNELVESGKFTEEQAQLAETWGSRTERRSRPADQLPSRPGQDRVEVLERLCAARWAERGFTVVCPRCALQSFVPLPEVGPTARCPGCQSLAAFDSSPATVTLYYRLNTLVDRALDQGVIPHLMVIATIMAAAKRSSLQPGVLVTFPGSEKLNEVDIYGIWDGRVVCGEVKTKAAEFTPDQINKDISISQRLGADVYLMAATDVIGPELRAQAEQACVSTGLSLEVLSNAELFLPEDAAT